MDSQHPAPDLLSLPWLTCRHPEGGLGMGIVYAQSGTEASPVNALVAVLGSPEMAALVCVLHNDWLAAKLAGHSLA